MLLTRTEKEAEKQKAVEVKGLKPKKSARLNALRVTKLSHTRISLRSSSGISASLAPWNLGITSCNKESVHNHPSTGCFCFLSDPFPSPFPKRVVTTMKDITRVKSFLGKNLDGK
jgi:hypothetical protein